MQQTRCINCLRIIVPDVKYCPHCGYDQQIEQPFFALRMHTILKGRYLTGRVIDKDGFGITYTGLDLKLEQRVVIREFYPGGIGIVYRNDSRSNRVIWDSGFGTSQAERSAGYVDGCIERIFKQVCQTASISDNPAIVSIRDAFRENETACIVTEFIDGKTLGKWLSMHGRMTWKECKQMLLPLMDGIARAHDYGIIHGDISPDNILVQADKNAKLKGIEEPMQVKYIIEAKKDDSEHHYDDFIYHDPFKAPERFGRNEVGSWTDVYAFSAVLVYCVTGKLVPHWKYRMSEQHTKTENEACVREMLKEATEIPKGVKEVLVDALAIQREDRIQNMRAFRKRLERAESS